MKLKYRINKNDVEIWYEQSPGNCSCSPIGWLAQIYGRQMGEKNHWKPIYWLPLECAPEELELMDVDCIDFAWTLASEVLSGMK